MRLPCVLLICLSFLSSPHNSIAATAPRLLGLEHVPIVVRDLSAAVSNFQALGFTIKPGRNHTDGIQNALVKFEDGSYLELICAPKPVDELTSDYFRWVQSGDGPEYVSLYVAAINGLQLALADLHGEEEDGTVTFPAGPLHPFFFGTREKSPTDLPAHFVHANQARALDAIWLAPDNLADVETFVSRLGAPIEHSRVCLARCSEAKVARMPEGEIVLLGKGERMQPRRPILGLSIRVSSLRAIRDLLRQQASSAPAKHFRDNGADVLIPPTVSNGVWLDFHQGAVGHSHINRK